MAQLSRQRLDVLDGVPLLSITDDVDRLARRLVDSGTVPRMSTDEIVEEIRRRRQEHAASFDYDVTQIVRDLQRREKASARRFVTRAPKKPSEVGRGSSV